MAKINFSGIKRNVNKILKEAELLLFGLSQKDAEKEAQKAIKILERLFEQTFDGFTGHNDSGYATTYPSPVFGFTKPVVRVIKAGRNSRVEIEFTTFASNTGAVGDYHALWYILDEGVEPYTLTEDSAVFPTRSRQRFVESSGLYFGHAIADGEIGSPYAQLKAGDRNEGFSAFNMSQRIYDQFLVEVASDPDLSRWIIVRPGFVRNAK